MDRNNTNDRTTARVVAATAIIATVALLALAGLTGSICAAIDENAGGSDGEMTGAAVSATSVTTSINYQGRLTDGSGSPLTGTYRITFGLHEAATGGTALATDVHDVDVTDGLFNTGIDFDQVCFDGELWLGVTVDGDAEMMPRQELRPVPYALSLVPGARIIGSVYTALHAESTHPSGRGIRGCATATSGTNYGVMGTSKSPDGYGGYFYNNGGGTGVYGKGGDYGGFFTTNQGGPWDDHNAAVNATTTHCYSDGVHISTTGTSYSDGVHIYTTGYGSDGVYVNTTGKYSDGVKASTTGERSTGVHAETFGDNSDGFSTHTTGNYSYGVYAYTTGYNSAGVRAYSEKSDGVFAYTGRSDQMYGVKTPNKMCAYCGYDTGCADVAEYFPTPEDPEPGTVMVIDPAGASRLMSSTKAYDTTVAGIVSTAPGVSLGTKEGGNDGEKLIAVAGRVPCKVDASYAAIKPGDLLTTSDTPGHAMKAQPVEIGGIEIYRPGTTIGKALEPLATGTGTIEVLVTLQ